MKKVIKKEVKEIAEFSSDFTNQKFELNIVPVEIKISCGYGSKFDGASFSLELDDEDLKPILELIASKLSKEKKKQITKALERFNDEYDSSMDSRDWGSCDFISHNRNLFENLLSTK